MPFPPERQRTIDEIEHSLWHQSEVTSHTVHASCGQPVELVQDENEAGTYFWRCSHCAKTLSHNDVSYRDYKPPCPFPHEI